MMRRFRRIEASFVNMLPFPSPSIPGGWRKRCAFKLTVRSLRGLAIVPNANIRTSVNSTTSCIMAVGLFQKVRDSERTVVDVSNWDKSFCSLPNQGPIKAEGSMKDTYFISLKTVNGL